MKFTISRSSSLHGGTYYAAAENGQKAGYMTYRTDTPGIMVIDHTKVQDAYHGQGIGELLIQQAVTDTKKENLKIRPV